MRSLGIAALLLAYVGGCGDSPSPADRPSRSEPRVADPPTVEPETTEPAPPDPAPTTAEQSIAPPLGRAPPPTPTMVMAGVWPFSWEQDQYGVPCRLDLDRKGTGSIDAHGVITLDPSGRIGLIRKQSLEGTTYSRMEFGYDELGRLAHVGTGVQALHFGYDDQGRLATRRYENMGCQFVQRIEYVGDEAIIHTDDDCDESVDERRVGFVKDQHGRWNFAANELGIEIRYDSAGRPAGIDRQAEPHERIERDANGRIVRMTPLDSTWIAAKDARLLYTCED